MRRGEVSNVGVSSGSGDCMEVGPKPGLFRAIHGTTIVAEFSTTELRSIPVEGATIKFHGSLWLICHVSWCYSCNLDSFDVVAEVRPVNLVGLLFGDDARGLDLMTQAINASGLSEFAYLKAACRQKQSIDVILRDGEKAAALRSALGADL